MWHIHTMEYYSATKKKTDPTDFKNKLMVPRGKDGGEGTVREPGMDVDTGLCLTWRTSKGLLDSTGNSAQCHVAARMGGQFGGEWIHVHVRLSPSTIHLKLYPNTI